MRNVFRTLLLGSFLLLIPFISGAQNHGVCGTHPDATIDRLLKNKKAIENGFVKTRGAVTYIPVKYHLVAKSNGSGRVDIPSVLEMHCHLNEMYADQDLQFYVKDNEYNYIDNDAAYNNHANTVAFVLNPAKDPNALNVYIVKDATPGGGGQGPGTVLGYYSPQYDWIIMRTDQVDDQSQTLPHEAGHFFSLPHPFRGWEGEPFDNSFSNWPVALATAPNGSSQTEKMDGSNCTTAADFFCDTPPDYNFGLVNGTSCNYSGGAQDPMGVPVDPDETLIMSYFSDRCVNKFSDEQKAAIAADVASNDRAFLRLGWTPAGTTVNNEVNPIYPPDGEAVPYNATIRVDWSDVPGASAYIFEFSENRFFTGTVRTFFLDRSSVEVDNLQDKTTYYWRIRPYNEYYTCGAGKASPTQSFTADSDVVRSQNNIEFVSQFNVVPNPLGKGQSLSLILDSQKNFDAQVQIFSITGKIMHQQSASFHSDTNHVALDPVNLHSGVYIIAVRSAEGVLNRKFVVN